MNITDHTDAASDEALYKDLVALKAAHQAPHPKSPLGLRLSQATARHEARQAGREVPRVAIPTPPNESSDLSKMLPNQELRDWASAHPDDPMAKSVLSQVEYYNRIGRRRHQLQKAVAEGQRILAEKLAKSTGGEAPTITVVRAKD